MNRSAFAAVDAATAISFLLFGALLMTGLGALTILLLAK